MCQIVLYCATTSLMCTAVRSHEKLPMRRRCEGSASLPWGLMADPIANLISLCSTCWARWTAYHVHATTLLHAAWLHRVCLCTATEGEIMKDSEKRPETTRQNKLRQCPSLCCLSVFQNVSDWVKMAPSALIVHLAKRKLHCTFLLCQIR